jgi:acyl carrier protein
LSWATKDIHRHDSSGGRLGNASSTGKVSTCPGKGERTLKKALPNFLSTGNKPDNSFYSPFQMADASIEEKVKDIIVEQLGVSEDQVKSEAKFIEDLGADSLDTVELVMAFEEEFDITVPDEEAEKLTSVGEVVAYIESQAK